MPSLPWVCFLLLTLCCCVQSAPCLPGGQEETRPPLPLLAQHRHPLVTRGATLPDAYQGDAVLIGRWQSAYPLVTRGATPADAYQGDAVLIGRWQSAYPLVTRGATLADAYQGDAVLIGRLQSASKLKVPAVLWNHCSKAVFSQFPSK